MSENEKNVNLEPEITEEELIAKNVFTMSPLFKEIVSWVMCLAIALVAALVIRTWLFTVVKVKGESMYPTLHDGDRLITRIIGYTPKRGDIIIFHPKSDPKTAYVKRVIAVEGDRLWINPANGDVHLKKSGSNDWEMLEEKYIAEKIHPATLYACDPDLIDLSREGLLIKEDHIFVMGDNRNHSKDSRDSSLGQVPFEAVIGKSQIRIFPFTSIGITE